MKFTIYQVQNGFLLNFVKDGVTKSYVFASNERMRLLAFIDSALGPEADISDN
jgi:hypothetical protein